MSSATESDADDKLKNAKIHQIDNVDGTNVSNPKLSRRESVRSVEEAMSRYYEDFGTPEDALSSFFDSMVA